MISKKSVVASLAVAAMVAAPHLAKASFIYSVAPATTTESFGAGSTLVISAYNGGITSPTLSGLQYINLAQITLNSTTVPPATDTATIPFSLSTTITNMEGGGSGAIVLNGTFDIARCDTQGEFSTFMLTNFTPSTITLGNYQYTLSNPVYAPPTIGAGSAGNGALSVVITETLIPEPASLSLLALGGLALLARRRK